MITRKDRVKCWNNLKVIKHDIDTSFLDKTIEMKTPLKIVGILCTAIMILGDDDEKG